eukprot:CAMPEP_0172458694 /NCGR_PEP_ID=MMETSP1065-20121228/28809_1 /TAXON_ID=265537 /ORGANISM="Amphiprora paludosa, Strain CCMP125" /LENGTH=239 /DNA_ID=CAMNT_0013213073 /DNA_START=51 /DNA_END=770 /DNA_ORIENTATION=+
MSPSTVSARTLQRIFQSIGRPRNIFYNSLAGCILFGISDALAQEVEHRQGAENEEDGRSSAKEWRAPAQRQLTSSSTDAIWTIGDDFDQTRFVTAAGMGVFLTGFLYPAAYARLDALFVGKHWQAVIKKSVTEVATVGIFVNSISMFGRGYLTGRHTPQECVTHLRKELPMVTFNDARLWIPYNCLAFGFIPIHIRPVTTSFMEAAWQTYISLRSNNYNQHSELSQSSVIQSPIQVSMS